MAKSSPGFPSRFAQALTQLRPELAVVRVSSEALAGISGKGTLHASTGVSPSAPGSASHERIIGEYRGRYWELSPLRLGALDTWFTQGRPILRVSTWFRAAPAGKERSQDTPWALLGPKSGGWDEQTADERCTHLFAEDRRGGKLETIRVNGISAPLVASASHPGLERSLRSARWLDWYRGAYELTAPGGLFGGRLAPRVVAMNCWLSLYLDVNFDRSPEEYARFVASFFEQADLIEQGFEAPVPSQEPFAWKWDEPLPNVRWPMPEPTFVCPKCGALEAAAHFTNRRYVWKQFLISGACHEFLFRDSPPGVSPDAAVAATRVAARS